MSDPIAYAAPQFGATEPVTEIVSFEAALFAADVQSRTLTGVLLPFGEVSGWAKDPTTGTVGKFTFSEATTAVGDPGDVILNYGHDLDALEAQVGIGTSLTKTPAGVVASFKIAKTPEGDRVLALAEAKILRFFSAEVEGTFATGRDGVRSSVATSVVGAAVVRKPAFAGAGITHVAAGAAGSGDITMKCEKCGQVHADGVTECTAEALAAFAAANAPKNEPVKFSEADGAKLMADVQALAEQIAALNDIKIPVGPGTQQFQVAEEPIYRFAGTEPAPSGFDFATDLLAAAKDGDAASFARIQKFSAAELKPQFADQLTTTGDVAAVNQSTYRPDMFLGQVPTPPSPLYDFFYKGGLTGVKPFFWSKLDRTNTDIGVSDHTEGLEPEARDIVTQAGATVTPTPVSGRVHITREVADQGGDPVVSGLVKAEFDRSFKIALETKTAALITAAWAGMTALATITTGTSGINAGLAVEGGLVDLQFLADGSGSRFERAFGHADLYKALALAANASTGEKLYPILGPTNRDGTATSKWASLQIAGWGMYPTISLGAAGGTKNSLVADSTAVHVWASGLQRFDKLQEKVEGWDIGAFAYFAGVVYDITGLRKIVYTP